MAPLRPDTLAVALSRAFEDAQDSRASWFALTRGERLFSAGDRADTLYLPVSYTHLTLPTKRIV